jgi:hypothetical protein
VSHLGNYIADKNELNDMINEYNNTMQEWYDGVSEFTKVGGDGDQDLNEDFQEASRHSLAIKMFWNDMVSVDSEAATNFQQATDGFIALSTTIDSFKGDLGKGGANLGALDIEKLQSVMFKDDVLCARLMEKMLTEEGLTYAEREILYHYFQSEILTDEKVAEFEEIVELLQDGSEESQQVLQEKINQLLISEEALDLHMAELQAFLFMGNLTPDEFAKNQEERERNQTLYAYLAALTSSKEYVNNAMILSQAKDLKDLDPSLAHLKYTDPDGIRMHVIDMEIRVGDNYTGEGKYGAHLGSWGPGHYNIVKNEEITIKYYQSPNARSQMDKDKANAQVEAYNSYNKNFFAGELPVLGASLASGKYAPLLEGAFLAQRYMDGKVNLEKQMARTDLEVTVGQLKFEAMTVENHTKNQAYYHVIPSKDTEDVLDRWEEVSHINPEIPFPEEDVRKKNWNEVNDFYNKCSEIFDDYPEALLRYIDSGTLEGSLNDITTKNEEDE